MPHLAIRSSLFWLCHVGVEVLHEIRNVLCLLSIVTVLHLGKLRCKVLRLLSLTSIALHALNLHELLREHLLNDRLHNQRIIKCPIRLDIRRHRVVPGRHALLSCIFRPFLVPYILDIRWHRAALWYHALLSRIFRPFIAAQLVLPDPRSVSVIFAVLTHFLTFPFHDRLFIYKHIKYIRGCLFQAVIFLFI